MKNSNWEECCFGEVSKRVYGCSNKKKLESELLKYHPIETELDKQILIFYDESTYNKKDALKNNNAYDHSYKGLNKINSLDKYCASCNYFEKER